jgi:hypothetical protein
MGAAPRTRLGVAGGLLNMMRGLGTSFGVALVGLVLTLNLHDASTDAAPAGTVLHSLRLVLLCLVVAALGAGVLSFRRRRGMPPLDVEHGELV